MRITSCQAVLFVLSVTSAGRAGAENACKAGDPVQNREAPAAAARVRDDAAAVRSPPLVTKEVEFACGENRLAGVLSVPNGTGPFPAVVFVTGSNAADRTYGGVTAALGSHFGLRGIASLAWDKPGVGRSTGDYQRQTLEDRAREALAAVRFLQTRAEIRHDQVGLWGHSQGGMVAPLAASRSRDVAFVIEVAGWQGPAWQQDLVRVEAELRAGGFDEPAIRSGTGFARRRMDLLRGSEPFEVLEAAQQAVNDEPWFKHVHWCDRQLFEYARRNVGYDTTTWWERVHCPVLACYGGQDRSNGPAERHVDVIRRGLEKADNKDVTFIIFADADHSLCSAKKMDRAKGDEPADAQRGAGPDFVKGYLKAMSDWVTRRTSAAGGRERPRLK